MRRRYLITSVVFWLVLLVVIYVVLQRFEYSESLSIYAKVTIIAFFLWFVSYGIYKFVRAYKNLRDRMR